MMRKMRGSKTRWLFYTAILLLAVLLVSSALLLLDFWDRRQGIFPEQDTDLGSDTLLYDGQEYVLNDRLETVLVMGLDKYEGDFSADAYNNDRQADFLLLLVIDNAASTCRAIHINRDTMTEMNLLGVAGQTVGTVTKQIALAHTYGNGREVSCRNTADAVSKLFSGIEVDHYLSLTMDSVAVFNDLVGGVEVTVLDDFTGIDESLVKGETVTLMGEQALRYVRSRKGLEDSSNSSRMERQSQYLKALYAQTKTCADADEDFLVDATLKMSDFLVSDCSVTQLQGLFGKISSYEFEEIRTIDGENVMGEEFIEFYPKEASLQKIVVDMFYKPKDQA